MGLQFVPDLKDITRNRRGNKRIVLAWLLLQQTNFSQCIQTRKEQPNISSGPGEMQGKQRHNGILMTRSEDSGAQGTISAFAGLKQGMNSRPTEQAHIQETKQNTKQLEMLNATHCQWSRIRQKSSHKPAFNSQHGDSILTCSSVQRRKASSTHKDLAQSWAEHQQTSTELEKIRGCFGTQCIISSGNY